MEAALELFHKQISFLSVCLCFGFKTCLPLTTLRFTLQSSLKAQNLAFGVKPNGNLCSQSAAQSLGKL